MSRLEKTETLINSSLSIGEGGVRWRPPEAGLEPFVFGHSITHWMIGDEKTRISELLHYPCVNLVSDSERSVVHGLRRPRSVFRWKGSGFQFGTNFLPGGFAAFTSVRVEELNDRVVPLTLPFGASGGRVADELVELAADGDANAYFAALEAFLLARRPTVSRSYELVREAEKAMLTAAPGTTVAEVAAGLGVSMRTLQRAFHDHVGIGPKWVLLRYRMHAAAVRIREGEELDAASLAVDLGYSDQAHFIRDFKGQVGLSPLAYERSCRSRQEGWRFESA